MLFLSGCIPGSFDARPRSDGTDDGEAVPVRDAVELRDTFGRPVRDAVVQLLDWEGPIANPAIRFVLATPPGGERDGDRFPLRVDLAVGSMPGSLPSAVSRLMFDNHSTVGREGPGKTLFLRNPGDSAEFYMSVFGDRDGVNDAALLRITVTDALGQQFGLEHPILVLDQDREREIDFRVHTDFSHDETGMLNEPDVRVVVRQAADDWAYYFADPGLSEVAAGAETAWVWERDGFTRGREVVNRESYTGYWLLVHGITHAERRSGGAASDRCSSCVQIAEGRRTGLRRSGTVSIETEGNWTSAGWRVCRDPDDWWRLNNADDGPGDLLSILTHEVGHALVFHRVHPAFDRRVRGGQFVDPAVRNRLGFDPTIDSFEHFPGLVDPTTLTGVFGNEYGGRMPKRRWQIARMSLRIAEAIGYPLRDTTPFDPLRFEFPSETPPTAGQPTEITLRTMTGRPAEIALRGSGGVPLYCFRVVEGKLPAGLRLDSRSGSIDGVAVSAGRERVVVELRDNDLAGPSVRATVEIIVESP